MALHTLVKELNDRVRERNAALSESEKEIIVRQLVRNDDANRKLCEAKLGHAAWRANISEAELLIYAQSSRDLTELTKG